MTEKKAREFYKALENLCVEWGVILMTDAGPHGVLLVSDLPPDGWPQANPGVALGEAYVPNPAQLHTTVEL
jgi:hypothetical protein